LLNRNSKSGCDPLNMPNQNIELLKHVAIRLGPLLSEVVFVGGCTTDLFITDEGAAEVRPTFDVDVIAEITSYPAYEAFSERLRAQGFREDASEGAPRCRWMIDEMKLDVMPLDESVLGFTNRWYREAMNTAQEIELNPALRIRAVTAPYFVATKLEAFRGRGRGDFTGSHDLEDILAVIDGREVIVEEIATATDVRSYIAKQLRTLLETQTFLEALPGHLLPDRASQARLTLLVDRMKRIAALL
jgi:predicted nucleotidyltransferase